MVLPNGIYRQLVITNQIYPLTFTCIKPGSMPTGQQTNQSSSPRAKTQVSIQKEKIHIEGINFAEQKLTTFAVFHGTRRSRYRMIDMLLLRFL